MSEPTTDPAAETKHGSATSDSDAVQKRIVTRAGGRHLVFRINEGRHWFLPRPYALISNIEGSILVFYGIGQIWVTHRKLRRINDWLVRVPRFVAKRIVRIVDGLEPDIAEFIEHIQHLDLIGTLIIERKVIEFHWTVPRNRRDGSDPLPDPQAIIDLNFNNLATAFARLQLVGNEGEPDCVKTDIELQPRD